MNEIRRGFKYSCGQIFNRKNGQKPAILLYENIIFLSPKYWIQNYIQLDKQPLEALLEPFVIRRKAVLYSKAFLRSENYIEKDANDTFKSAIRNCTWNPQWMLN